MAVLAIQIGGEFFRRMRENKAIMWIKYRLLKSFYALRQPQFFLSRARAVLQNADHDHAA